MLGFEESYFALNEDESSNKPSGVLREKLNYKWKKKERGGFWIFPIGICGFVLVQRLKKDLT